MRKPLEDNSRDVEPAPVLYGEILNPGDFEFFNEWGPEDVPWQDIEWVSGAEMEIHMEPWQAWKVANVLTGNDHLNPPEDAREFAINQLVGDDPATDAGIALDSLRNRRVGDL